MEKSSVLCCGATSLLPFGNIYNLYIIALFWLISQAFQNGDYHGTSQ